jgi:hypothetical protein
MELIPMTPIRPFRLAALVAVAAFATACSDSTAPSDLQPAELSQVLAEMQPAALAPLNSQISAAPVAALSAPVPSSCSYDGTSKSFVCPSVSVTGITVSRSFTLFDASGNPQSAFDRATTAAVRMQTSFAGTVTSGSSTVNIDQQQDVTMSGLLTGVRTLNGTSLGHIAGSIGNGTTTTPIASTISTTITNLVLPTSSTGANRFPASGTIAATTTTTIGALPASTVNAAIAFDGTSKAAVTITANGITTHCTVDLTAQSAVLCTV